MISAEAIAAVFAILAVIGSFLLALHKIVGRSERNSDEIETIKHRVKNTDQNLAALNGHHDRTLQRVVTIETKMLSIDSTLSDIKHSVERANDTIEKHTDQVRDSILALQTAHASSLAAQTTQFNQLAESIRELRSVDRKE